MLKICQFVPSHQNEDSTHAAGRWRYALPNLDVYICMRQTHSSDQQRAHQSSIALRS